MKVFLYGIFATAITISTTAIAQIYQWTDKQDHVHYSDTVPDIEKTKDGIRLRDERNLPGFTRIYTDYPGTLIQGRETTTIGTPDGTLSTNNNGITLVRKTPLKSYDEHAEQLKTERSLITHK